MGFLGIEGVLFTALGLCSQKRADLLKSLIEIWPKATQKQMSELHDWGHGSALSRSLPRVGLAIWIAIAILMRA